ncbi:retrovirus-related pol polyprotein from transposon TNT 1-94 [Tanacetum coccineum]|uniref:Retrovirus-related pol polyprotein from transposon TNT 1-94 n=1 Tax=Tanacetum coccineum TaxID=301880 RepID=A0ABQ4XBY5_9ASTR
MINNQKPSGDKLGLGFNSFEASSSGTREIKFVKAQKKASPDGGPINMGGPLNVQAAPKINMGPPPVTHVSEKSMSFQKSILGPRPKHIIVNKTKVPVASDNEVKQFYKPLSKPRVGFSKPNFRSKTPPPRRVNNNYSRLKTPQPKRHVGRQNQPHGFPICLGVNLEPDEWIKDSGCSKHMTGNRKLFSTYKAYNGGNVIFGSNLRGNIIGKGQICDNKCRVTFSEHDSEITMDGKVIDREPKNVNEELGDKSWIVAMQEELNQFITNDVWELVPQPMNMTIIGTKWVFRNKLDENRIVSRNKARLVAQGYNQQEGIDYDETYAPVYVAQPPGFIDFEKLDHVYKLKKALYGLKQAPKAWYDRLKAFLIKHEYKMGMVDNTLFTKKKSSNLIIVQIYVDDIIFGLTCQDMCDEFAKIMHDEFEMSMMGKLNFFLGLQIKQMEDGIFFNQSKYIKEMLKKFGLEDSKPMKTPHVPLEYNSRKMKKVGLRVCLCARFQEAPKTSHLEAVKRIFRYIKGTTHLGLWYPKGTGIETIVYADSDHAGDYVDRKSTSGIYTFVGCCLTSWFSKKQTALAISTTEAEYISARKACQQALWMKQALINYNVRLEDVPIMCDNKCAIDLSKNPVQHSRTKHIEIRHHFLRDNVQKGHISIEKVPSVDNIADILTKPLKRESFNYQHLGLGMMEHIP